MAHPVMFDDDDPFLARLRPLCGWMALDLADPDTDWDEVAELLDASYRNIAPPKLVAELDARSG